MPMGSLREEDDSSSLAAKNGRLLRLEHILGGKSRRGVHRACEGGSCPGESKLEDANTKGVITDETMLEASTNSCISDNVHPDNLGLEIAMKQLMEATHDALVNMKGAPTPSECSTAALGERGKVRMCNVPIPMLVSSLKEEAKLFATTHRPSPPLPPHHYSCNSVIPVDLPEVQPELGHNMLKENALAASQAPHQRKEVFPQKTMHEKRPALRILKPKNFKISDLLVSDSDDESTL